jgi:hypothetical protein
MTSPIFCAACASAAICSLVPLASQTAARTISVVRLSWRPISPMEPVNSSAAPAAVSTLVQASFDAVTALSALFEVCPESANSVVAVERMVSAPSLTVRRCAPRRAAEGGDCRVDHAAALLLLLHKGALALGVAPLGDVLMRRHPAAARHRPVGDQDGAAVFGFAFFAARLAALHRGQKLGAIVLDVAREAALRGAVFEQLDQCRARPRHGIRHLLHVAVAAVAHHQPLVGVEHAQVSAWVRNTNMKPTASSAMSAAAKADSAGSGAGPTTRPSGTR